MDDLAGRSEGNTIHILMCAAWFYPNTVGGTEMYVCELSKELQRAGFKITIAAPSVDEKEHSYIYQGLSVYCYPVALNPSRDEFRDFIEPKYIDCFKNYLEKEKPDIVHFHAIVRGTHLPYVQTAKQLKIPVVYTFHTPTTTCDRGTMMRWGKVPCDGELKPLRCAACHLHGRGMPRWMAWLFSGIPWPFAEWFEKKQSRISTVISLRRILQKRKNNLQELFRLTTCIVALSKWQYDTFVKNGLSRSKLVLCRHGISLINFSTLGVKRPKKNATPFIMGYLGRLDDFNKGIDILIRAFRQLPSSIQIELRIHGKCDLAPKDSYLEKLKSTARGDARIKFCGELTSGNRQKAFEEMDILAVPSRWFETGPLVVLEAFDFGVPVIGSNFGGIAEWVEDGVNGLLLSHRNVKAWANAIKLLVDDRSMVDKLKTGIPMMRSIKDVASEMSAIYEISIKK